MKGVLKVEASDYVLSKVGIVTTKPSKDDYFGIGKDLPANQEFAQFTEIKTPSGLARLEWTRNFNEDSESKIKVQLRFPKDRTFNLWLLGGDIYDFRVLGKQLFLQTHNPASQHDRTTFTHQIDCESGKSKLIISGVGENSFTPKKLLWLANDRIDNNLEQLDDGRRVRVNHLYSGNWKTGQRWTITGKLTDVVSAALK